MSTPQTDAHWDFQKTVYQEFDETVEAWKTGEKDYDEVEDSLRNLVDDEDVSLLTYEKCEKLWELAKQEDEYWMNEETDKWAQLNKDQGA